MTYSRRVARQVVGTVGVGRYAMQGAFSEPIDFGQRLFFAGIEVAQTSKAALLISFRRTIFGGMTTFPAAARSPNFTGSALVVEQRLAF